MTISWDEEVDLLVVGSGAGGMMAALVAANRGATVLIVEKEPLWGGTSATSGGGIWIPASDPAAAAGFADDPDDAFRYVRSLSADNVPDANIRAYVDNAAVMLRWMMAHTPIDYIAFPYPDYHAENDGGSPTGYRTHMPAPLDGRRLGRDVETLRFASPAASLFGYINWHFDETYALLYRSRGWQMHIAKALARYWLDLPFRLRSRKDRRLTLGNALAGGLRMALNERRVPLWLDSPLRSIVREQGRVAGAVVFHEGRERRIAARRGVVLAAGGFEKNPEMRAAHTPLYPATGRSGGIDGNTGDGIRAATAIGAETMNLHSAWAAPVFYVPGDDRGRLCTIERALPGCIMVNGRGERFLNEAASYHIVGQQMARRQRDHGDGDPCWILFDARYRRDYPMGPVYPMIPDAMLPKAVRGILRKGRTVAALAGRIGVDAATLDATIARFNRFAIDGQDPDFHRGEAAYDRMYGDPRQQPNPTLRPLTRAPFYAMPIYPGDIGTNGGLRTDADARVIGEDGLAIDGLYAIGNSAASAMGESYPGAGVTIGPALTFGYLAARHLTGAN